jgi:lipopolysaccharide assembly outer membrane protein LptD (OstA)
MKTILSVGFLAYFLCAPNAIAQITTDKLVGTWGLVGFDMKAQNKNGTLTEQESQTVSMMQKALKQQPKFMRLTFSADGSFTSEPDAYKDKAGKPTWELKDNVVIIKINNKVVERYNARIAFNGWLELKAVKSKIAIPVMSLEKD